MRFLFFLIINSIITQKLIDNIADYQKEAYRINGQKAEKQFFK